MEQFLRNRKNFSPIIFPWYSASLSKTDLVIRMCATAYALDIRLMEEVVHIFQILMFPGYYTSRSAYLELLTHDPKIAKVKTLFDSSSCR